jgi:selenocysteine lyase/cysteine desulfurase
VRHLLDVGVEEVQAHENVLVTRFLDGAASIPGLTVHSPKDPALRCGVLSFNVDGLPPSDVGLILDQDYGILGRAGLHCAPGAHRTIGTFPVGSMRFGFSHSNTTAEVDTALGALQALASWAGSRTSVERDHV